VCVRCPISDTPSCPISLGLSVGRRIFGPMHERGHAMIIIYCRRGSVVLLRWVQKLCILRSPWFCVRIPARSGVRVRTVRDRAELSERISGLSGHIWCCLGSFVPGPFVIRAQTVRDRAEWSGLYPDDLAMYGATWTVYAWTHVEYDGPAKYVGRSVTYLDGLAYDVGLSATGPNCPGLYQDDPAMYGAT
jgi:hypothetical protein